MASSVTKQLDNKRAQEPFGSDLGATNIERGRDHGLPPWNDFREFCGLPRYNSFDDIPDMCPFTLDNLKSSYEWVNFNIFKVIWPFFCELQRIISLLSHIDDVDLFVGALLEQPVDGGAVGETFACLNAKQFELLKNGDRYFYTNGKNGGKTRGFKYSAGIYVQYKEELLP